MHLWKSFQYCRGAGSHNNYHSTIMQQPRWCPLTNTSLQSCFSLQKIQQNMVAPISFARTTWIRLGGANTWRITLLVICVLCRWKAWIIHTMVEGIAVHSTQVNEIMVRIIFTYLLAAKQQSSLIESWFQPVYPSLVPEFMTHNSTPAIVTDLVFCSEWRAPRYKQSGY